MNMQEQQQKVNNISITYGYRKGKYDCRHLLVVFSDFGSNKSCYDFTDSLEPVPSHILWLKDYFFDNCCCYLCHKMDFSIEKTVTEFISNFCQEHFLDNDNITLVGIGKGGTAALYFSIKYKFKNAIAVLPQIHLGSFINKMHKDVAAHMMCCEEDIQTLDQLLQKTITSATDTNKNIYFFSSSADQDETYTQIHDSLKKFQNFNHISTESHCIKQHDQIIPYNLPLILSLILAHGQGIHPRFAEWFTNGYSAPQSYTDTVLQRQRARKEVVARLTACSSNQDVFFPEGVAFLRGIPSSTYGTFTKYLILERIDNVKRRYCIPFGSTSSDNFSFNYYEDVYCDYQTIGFASANKKGISFAGFPIGHYRLLVRVEGEGLAAEAPLQMVMKELAAAGEQHIYRLSHKEGVAHLHILSPLSDYKPDICTVTKHWIKENTIHYEGYALRYGIEAGDWADIDVWLVLKKDDNFHIFKYAKNKNVALNTNFDGCGIYATSNFCSPACNGIDISSLDKGEYDVFISLQYKHCLLSEQIAHLTVDAQGVHSRLIHPGICVEKNNQSLVQAQQNVCIKAIPLNKNSNCIFNKFKEGIDYLIDIDILRSHPDIKALAFCFIDMQTNNILFQTEVSISASHISCSYQPQKGETSTSLYIYSISENYMDEVNVNISIYENNVKQEPQKTCCLSIIEEIEHYITVNEKKNPEEALLLREVLKSPWKESIYLNLFKWYLEKNILLTQKIFIFKLYTLFVTVPFQSFTFFDRVFSTLKSYYEEHKITDKTTEMLIKILFEDSREDTVLAYRFEKICSSAYEKLLAQIKTFYTSQQICQNSIYPLILTHMSAEEASRRLKKFFPRLTQMMISIFFKNLPFDIVRSSFMEYIKETLNGKNNDIATIPLANLFEQVLLLSCFDKQQLLAYIKQILAQRQKEAEHFIYKSLKEAYIKHIEAPIISAPRNLRGKFKIALCVSGQLRGYETAFASWKKLGIYDHEVDTYVTTWDKVGRKFPITLHASRSFDGKFLHVYKNVFQDIPLADQPAYLQKQYPAFFTLLQNASNHIVTEKELKDFYGTEYIYIEDDTTDTIKAMSNAEKMYYNIQKCYGKLQGKYDLVIRIRPDLELIHVGEKLNFQAIYEKSYNNFSIFVNNINGRTYFFSNMWSYSIDDSFAIGTQQAMQAYSQTYDNTLKKTLYKLPTSFDGHRSLAYSTFYEGLSVQSSSHYQMRWVLRDPALLAKKDIYEALHRDISNRSLSLREDQLLLEASIYDLQHTENKGK